MLRLRTPKLHPSLTQIYTVLFFRDRVFLLMTITTLIGNAALWVLLAWQFTVLYQPGRDYIALHYKVVFGVDWLGRWYYIFLIPVTGLVVFVLHYFLARRAYHYQKTIQHLLMIAAGACQIILFFSLYLIIQANLF
ncbi:MAG: hypothetical protein Q7R79_03395 [bacterium]|nr:hypothetical protein [bacterium]